MCEALIGKGIQLSVYDPNLILDNLVGANKVYIEEQLPHIGRLLCDSVDDELIEKNDLLILGNAYEDLRRKLASLNGRMEVLDLVRFFGKRDMRDPTILSRDRNVSGSIEFLPQWKAL